MKWHWQENELQTHWHLTIKESELLYKKTSHGRLGFVVSLKYFQNVGHFPEQCSQIPEVVVVYLGFAEKVRLFEPDFFSKPYLRSISHRASQVPKEEVVLL